MSKARDRLPIKLRLILRGVDGCEYAHDLYLRATETEGSFVYASPHSRAVKGVDLFTLYIPKTMMTQSLTKPMEE